MIFKKKISYSDIILNLSVFLSWKQNKRNSTKNEAACFILTGLGNTGLRIYGGIFALESTLFALTLFLAS